MMTQLTAADGHRLDCWMETATGTATGGVVILQEIFGITDQLKGVARMYAAEGHDVAIPALFDRQRRNAVIPYRDAPAGRDMMLATDLEQVMADIGAAVAALAGRGLPVGVIGFCWGGGLALRSAQVLDIAAAVAFYGTRMDSYLDRPLRAPLQLHCGTRDEHTPRDLVERVAAYLPGTEVHWYRFGHAFANDARPGSYDAVPAGQAHARTKAFLARHLA